MEPNHKHTISSNKKPSDLPVPLNLPEPVRWEPEHTQAPARYSQWRNYTSQRHVRDMAIAPDGNVWLATAGGVLRLTLDMACFTRYTSEHGLPGNAIMSIAACGSGLVWVVNQRGQLSYFDEESWHLYEWLDDPVHSMSVDQAGVLWLATPHAIVRVGEGASGRGSAPAGHDKGASGQGQRLSPLAVSPPRTIAHSLLPPARALAVGDKGDIWLCNAMGVYHHDGKAWQAHEIRGVLTLARQGGNLWLGTAKGLVGMNLQTNEKESSDSWPRGHVTALLPTTNGVWAAIGGKVGQITESKHLPRDKRWHEIPRRFDAHITRLASTSDGELLIATHAGLANDGLYDIDWYHTESPPETINFSNLVQALAIQRQQRHSFLWIGTARGLFRLDLANESWGAHPKARGHASCIRALVTSTSDNQLWVANWEQGLLGLKGIVSAGTVPPSILSLIAGTGSEQWATVALDIGAGQTQPDGLYHYDGSSWSLALSASKLRAENVLPRGAWLQTVAPAPDDRLWLGTSVGLFRYDRTSDDVEAVDTTLGIIRALLLLPDETLCVATTQGLYLGIPPHLKPVCDMERGLPTALAWDESTQTLWVGTDSGLIRLSRHEQKWTIQEEFNTHNSGLGADFVTALALHTSDEGQKQLWIGTPCGLSRYCY